jgi:hypothetical protein
MRDEAFESCLRAAQISPLAEFQVGLAWLALLQGNISSPQIFACIEQAVQRSPYYPEPHNLHGLVCEARHNYHTAIASYRLALAAMSIYPESSVKSHAGKVSINLVRSLSKAGRFKESVMECANLKSKGLYLHHSSPSLKGWVFLQLLLTLSQMLLSLLISKKNLQKVCLMPEVCKYMLSLCGGLVRMIRLFQ